MRYAATVQPWTYDEPSRFEELLEHLAALRARILAMAKDEITPEERARIAEEQRKKAEALNRSLTAEVERTKRR